MQALQLRVPQFSGLRQSNVLSGTVMQPAAALTRSGEWGWWIRADKRGECATAGWALTRPHAAPAPPALQACPGSLR